MSLLKRQSFLLLTATSTLISVAAFSIPIFSSQPTYSEVNSVTQMNIWQGIFLGFLQGITEFLPISSTAHLKVIPVVLGWGDPGIAFSAVIQLGSIVAVVYYFWPDLRRIYKGATRAIALSYYDDYDFRLCLGIALGTLPVLFFGLLIKIFIPHFDHSPMRSLEAIAFASILMSLLLGLAEKLGKLERGFDQLTITDGVLMGLAQSLALIPGVSRSGFSLTAGLFIGLERETAARYSFLLGIPSITIAGLVQLKDALTEELGQLGILPLVLGVISSTVFSYLAIALLLRFLKTQTTWVFIWYRLAFGVAILTAIGTGLLNNS